MAKVSFFGNSIFVGETVEIYAANVGYWIDTFTTSDLKVFSTGLAVMDDFGNLVKYTLRNNPALAN